MPFDAEFHRLSPNIAIWNRYDAGVKADLFSTAIGTASGIYLVDPIPIDANTLQSLLGPDRVAGLIVTNANHSRATPQFSTQLVSPIFAHPDAKIGLQECKTIDLSDGMPIAPDLMVVTIDGAAPGEIALHWAAEGGTLIFGDALINMGSNGFSFLPNKYCLKPKLMRRSLQKVLDYPCERILFAHGTPIVSQAKSRLANLLRDS